MNKQDYFDLIEEAISEYRKLKALASAPLMITGGNWHPMPLSSPQPDTKECLDKILTIMDIAKKDLANNDTKYETREGE